MVVVETERASRKVVRLADTIWPDALPHPQEEKIFSVVCGNSTLKWALHDGAGRSFVPTLAWSTEPCTLNTNANGAGHESSAIVLGRYMPELARRVVFGPEGMNEGSKQMALEKSLSRSATLLTVYLISTNSAHADGVAWLFSDIPCRVYTLQPDDFFTEAEGRYETMGMDRLACMRAAGKAWGFPALVIDGGTSLTYTACDRNGHIVGGGITAGLLPKFRTLANHTEKAPGMAIVQDPEQMLKAAESMIDKNEPLGFFLRNTQDAVVSSFLKEIGFHLREVVKRYFDDVHAKGSNEEGKGNNDNNGATTSTDVSRPQGQPNNTIPKIIVTGGDARILESLLKVNDNNLLPSRPDIIPYEVVVNKQLISHGIAAALTVQAGKFKTTMFHETDKKLLGCRVAKEFKLSDDDGDRVYRGTIAATIRIKNSTARQYLVLYDDADAEEMDLVQIHAALTLYSQVGEKHYKTTNDDIAKKIAAKKELAHQAARDLEFTNRKVQEHANSHRYASAAIASSAPKPKKAPAPPAAAKPVKPTTPVAQAVKPATPAAKPVKPTTPAATSSKRKPKEAPTSSTPKSKKAKDQDPDFDLSIDPSRVINRRVAKYFEGQIFFGTVSSYDPREGLWQIDYDDGDEEEFDKNELKVHLRLRESNKDVDKKGSPVK